MDFHFHPQKVSNGSRLAMSLLALGITAAMLFLSFAGDKSNKALQLKSLIANQETVLHKIAAQGYILNRSEDPNTYAQALAAIRNHVDELVRLEHMIQQNPLLQGGNSEGSRQISSVFFESPSRLTERLEQFVGQMRELVAVPFEAIDQHRDLAAVAADSGGSELAAVLRVAGIAAGKSAERLNNRGWQIVLTGLSLLSLLLALWVYLLSPRLQNNQLAFESLGIDYRTVAAREVEAVRDLALQEAEFRKLDRILTTAGFGYMAVRFDKNDVTYNKEFVRRWRLPDELAVEAENDKDAVRRFLLKQLMDEDIYQAALKGDTARIRRQFRHLLKLGDGDRLNCTEIMNPDGSQALGLVWSFSKHDENIGQASIAARLLPDFVNRFPEAVVVVDPQGSCVYVNDTAEELMGERIGKIGLRDWPSVFDIERCDIIETEDRGEFSPDAILSTADEPLQMRLQFNVPEKEKPQICRFSATPVTDDDNDVHALLLLLALEEAEPDDPVEIIPSVQSEAVSSLRIFVDEALEAVEVIEQEVRKLATPEGRRERFARIGEAAQSLLDSAEERQLFPLVAYLHSLAGETELLQTREQISRKDLDPFFRGLRGFKAAIGSLTGLVGTSQSNKAPANSAPLFYGKLMKAIQALLAKLTSGTQQTIKVNSTELQADHIHAGNIKAVWHVVAKLMRFSIYHTLPDVWQRGDIPAIHIDSAIENEALVIGFQDNGRIDLEALQRQAVTSGSADYQEARDWTDDRLLQLLLDPQLRLTNKKHQHISLAAVCGYVESLDGKLEFVTNSDNELRIEVSFPSALEQRATEDDNNNEEATLIENAWRGEG